MARYSLSRGAVAESAGAGVIIVNAEPTTSPTPSPGLGQGGTADHRHFPGITGSVEAIKRLLDLGDDPSGRLFAADSLEVFGQDFRVNHCDPQRPACPIGPLEVVSAEFCIPLPAEVTGP